MRPESNEFIAILAAIEKDEKKILHEMRTRKKKEVNYRLSIWIFWLGIMGPALLSIALAVSVKLGALPLLQYVALGCLAASYLMVFIYPLIGIWLHRGALKSFFDAPFASMLKANVERPMAVDRSHFERLCGLPTETLELGLLELVNEQQSFDKRTSMITGSVAKLGILPGALATLATIQSLGSQPSWVYAIAYANLALLAMSISPQAYLLRYQRMIGLTELAIRTKKQLLQADI